MAFSNNSITSTMLFEEMGQQLTDFTPVKFSRTTSPSYHLDKSFQKMGSRLYTPVVFSYKTGPALSLQQCFSTNGPATYPFHPLKSAYAQQVCLYATKVAYAQQVGHPISPWWCFPQFHVVYTPQNAYAKNGPTHFQMFPIHGFVPCCASKMELSISHWRCFAILSGVMTKYECFVGTKQ